MQKKKSIYLYFLKMIIFTFLFIIIQLILSNITFFSLLEERYGYEALQQMLWAGYVLLLLILYKNRYVFTQKRESFKEGFKYILPEVILSTIFLGFAIVNFASSKEPVSFFAIFNLFIQCIFIGVVEEFLCRGWLLNEFLERFSSSKKEIILSIIFSSFIFGILHFFNLGAGQNVIETTVQVLNAGVSGIFLALVYYKTKNIWLVVFSHFYWDFSLMLIEHNQLVDCYTKSDVSTSVVLSNILSGSIIVIGYLILCYWLYRKTDLYSNKSKDSKNYLIPIGVVIYLTGLFIPGLIFKDSDSLICPAYNNKIIGSEYNLIINNYSQFELIDSVSNYKLNLHSDKEKIKVILEDLINNRSIVLSDDYIDYLFVENLDSYSILIQVEDSKVLYATLNKDEINKSDNYLNYVKDSLKEYHTPGIRKLYIMNIKGDSYNYLALDTNVNKKMIFDKDNKLYFVEEK